MAAESKDAGTKKPDDKTADAKTKDTTTLNATDKKDDKTKTDAPKEEEGSNTGTIVGIILAAVAAGALSAGGYYCYKKQSSYDE